MADATVEGLLAQWTHVHEMTLAFLDAVPDEHWQFTPHPHFAPFAKQLRHVIGVRGVYAEALTTGRVDFSRKHGHYSGMLDRVPLRAALESGHEVLLAAVSQVPPDPSWRLDLFGMPTSLPHFLAKAIQHEAIHHGEWSVYASLAGFETPRLWKMNWGL
jgi:uncharacterized damage-inducible protein DinB